MNKTQPALTGIWKAYAVWRYRISLGPGTYLFRLWNGFFAGTIFLESDRLKTLPVGLQVIASMTGALNPNPSAQGKVRRRRPDLATAGVITVLPVIIVFLISQRLIVRAATAGAIQGE